MEKINGNSRIAQGMASGAAEVVERETRHATTSGDRDWLEDIANTIRALSPVTNTASVEKMREDLAQAVQTNHDFFLTASQESDRNRSFLQELQALRLLINQ